MTCFGVEAHGVDTDKRYHEVPHWMHLSFFSYDTMTSPELDQPEEEKKMESRVYSAREADDCHSSKEAKSGHSAHDIEVGANGFFIPNLRSEADQALMRLNARRASFSALANVAASPSIASKSQSRQRQLISGRDFHDILEACRPRNSQHTAPSALSSLLSMYEVMQKETHQALVDTEAFGSAPADDTARTRPVSSQLKEWGAIDFDEVAAIFMQSSSALKHRHQGTGSPHTHDPMSDRSSCSPSSMTSQLSSLFSRSLERHTPPLSYVSGFQFYSRPMADGIQMQRCLSMESLEHVDEIDRKVSAGKKSEESLCSLGTEMSNSEEQGHGKIVADGNDANYDLEETQKNENESLRNRMQQQDELFFVRNRAKTSDHKAQVGTSRAIDGPVGPSGSILPSSK